MYQRASTVLPPLVLLPWLGAPPKAKAARWLASSCFWRKSLPIPFPSSAVVLGCVWGAWVPLGSVIAVGECEPSPPSPPHMLLPYMLGLIQPWTLGGEWRFGRGRPSTLFLWLERGCTATSMGGRGRLPSPTLCYHPLINDRDENGVPE